MSQISPIERYNFGKIKTSVKIPNLIEVQRNSYHRFLQMYILPAKRENIGLQAVFNNVFPIYDFRETCALEFVSYSIGNWECTCGRLNGLENLVVHCTNCGEEVMASFPGDPEIICRKCGTSNKNYPKVCAHCGKKVRLKTKYSVADCQDRGMTYNVPLRVRVRLLLFEKDPETGAKKIKDAKEQDVFFGDIPLMTDNGTFVINGTERVIVSQLHRSSGVFFHESDDRLLYYAQIIPYRGAWVEFEHDAKNILYVRLDRKRKILATVFLKAMGLKNDEEILRYFYHSERLSLRQGKLFLKLCETLIGERTMKDILVPGSKKVLVPAGRKVTRKVYNLLISQGIEELLISDEELLDKAYAIADVVDKETGEVLIEAGDLLDSEKLSLLRDQGIEQVEIFFPEREDAGAAVIETLNKDAVKTTEEALFEVHRRIRPGDPPTKESATSLFRSLFLNPQRYDLSPVGRLKLNTRLRDEYHRLLGKKEIPLEQRLLIKEDLIAVVSYLLKLRNKMGYVDDIDHLGNRRVRSVGELLENQFRIGLARMERAVREKMSIYQDLASATPHDIINPKPVLAAVREFFGSSQLSQFMDQTNPLAEITHKRRLSALGPGGLSRERAGFEVRDVHPSHYGRICPIETPEGPNIGLISSLSCYARVNDFGFIETPYQKVDKGRILDYFRIINPGKTRLKMSAIVERSDLEMENKKVLSKGVAETTFEPYPFYLTAWEEDRYIIAQANAQLDEKGNFVQKRVNARKAGNFIFAPKDDVQFIDISPKQLVSVAASLIPFLEHDDANRALMGSNMQRQAVPLIRPEAPLVGTGMESATARDSGAVVICRRGGVVDRVDAERVIVRVTEEEEGAASQELVTDTCHLVKFKRSNQNTCINQRPLVREGERVTRGEVIADGPATDRGELALGRNVLVAFLPWRGYNFEDAIVVSEKLVKEDCYTSIHIEEFEIEARDTKLGPEEITRDIPNVSEDFLRDLDESGVVRIGTYIKPGDILVGKVTPKGETQLTPEEKLLRAIFGEKAGDVRDASLTVPPGIEGTVVDVKIFARKGVDKDVRALQIEGQQKEKIERTLNDELMIVESERVRRLIELFTDNKAAAGLSDPETGESLITKGTKLTAKKLRQLPPELVPLIRVKRDVAREVEAINELAQHQKDSLRQAFEQEVAQIEQGDELSPGVIKLVKVYVAMKRKLSVGDKMAGRHGNKGVIAKILPEEDMPFLPDGTPVEIILNPLGVPSRMNVGQILETHLGWAARALGLYFASPVFDGASELEIGEKLKEANVPLSGKTSVYDGMTGKLYGSEVTVGYIYMMKLHHLVDDKIHARSIGPYSLITQQPLGGKAQFGGQRFGEMEVWALEAYGAAYTLQEVLTAKSDDVYGRTKIYEAIVKGESGYESGIPESFNVLVRELQSLCLNIQLLKEGKPVVKKEPAFELKMK
jgi:DNA-directed RNA polymerase subunit beta